MEVLKQKKFIICILLFIWGTLFAKSIPQDKNLLTIREVKFTGNTRISERKIREMIFINENMKLTQKQLDTRINMSKAKLEHSRLFMFIDIFYNIDENQNVALNFSLGENVIFLEMTALEPGSFTRFSSISPKAPDFGFMVGSYQQAFFLGFPYVGSTPINLNFTFGHIQRDFEFYPDNNYSYEAVISRASIDFVMLPDWKIKLPVNFRYNIEGNSCIVDTMDLSGGLETLLDFSYLKKVDGIGFDLYAAINQGVTEYSWTLFGAGSNLYIKPVKWDEIILSAKFRSIISNSAPDYILPRIDSEYELRGEMQSNYFGKNSILFTMENWFYDLVVIPSALSDIHFNLLVFADLGSAGNVLTFNDKDKWNLATGAAIQVRFSAPLNLVIQSGYGYEVLNNSGGLFFVKLGYDFRQGNFYE
jgi:hypothetical protein